MLCFDPGVPVLHIRDVVPVHCVCGDLPDTDDQETWTSDKERPG